MFESCLKKQENVKILFTSCSTEEEKYEKLIEVGRANPPLDPVHKIPENIVEGCQSTMYLHSWTENGLVKFSCDSDALISAGLAALLIRVYSGETPETILKCPPAFLEELGIPASLTPNRANGLYSVHKRMKQDAIQHFIRLQSGSPSNDLESP